MNLYLVKRKKNSEYRWNMYNAFVIACLNEKRAEEIALKIDNGFEEWEVQLISNSSIYEKETIVLSDTKISVKNSCN